MQVWISSEALAALRAHSAEDPSVEACGLLLGRGGQVSVALRTANVAPDPRLHFEVDPRALIAAHRAERAGGPKLLGNYHSHPQGAATPSATDRACSAGDGSLWLIVAGGEVRAWAADPGGFKPLQLLVSRSDS